MLSDNHFDLRQRPRFVVGERDASVGMRTEVLATVDLAEGAESRLSLVPDIKRP